jgi:hypothetical protein
MTASNISKDDIARLASNYEKAFLDKTINSILENRGYKLTETIGHGSYAKVK